MRLKRTGRLVTAFAGLGTIGTMGLATAARRSATPLAASFCRAVRAASARIASRDGHAQWKLVENYCVKCHNTTDWAGNVAFDTMSADAVPEDAKIWEAAIKKLRSGLMPPPGKPQPEQAARASMVSWLETTLDKAQTTPYAGYVPLRRLNRREYANAVRDLLGLAHRRRHLAAAGPVEGRLRHQRRAAADDSGVHGPGGHRGARAGAAGGGRSEVRAAGDHLRHRRPT